MNQNFNNLPETFSVRFIFVAKQNFKFFYTLHLTVALFAYVHSGQLVNVNGIVLMSSRLQ